MPKHWFTDAASGRFLCIMAIVIVGLICIFAAGFSIRPALAAAPEDTFKTRLPGQLMSIPFTQLRISHDIYIVNADGTGLTALTNTQENECYPAWSPDASKIAFARRSGGHYVISVMNADGSNVHDLFDPDLTQRIDTVACAPVWSPDGEHIAFTSGRDCNLEVYIMKADGSNLKNLTMHPASDGFPAWSPDGAEIAFTSDRDGHMQTYACDLAGKSIRRIRDSETDDFAPSWSPDGKKILVSVKNDKRELYIEMIDANKPGAEKTPVGPPNACFASWARDGRHVAFTLLKSNPKRIDVLDIVTNTLVTVVPSHEAIALAAAQAHINPHVFHSYGRAQWSPDGRKLVFSAMKTGMRPGPPASDFEWPFRWLYLGAHGELFAPDRYTQPHRDELRIVPQDGGFALLHTGPKWSGTYAVVGPDCKIRLVASAPKEVEQSSMASAWPYSDESGHPVLPPYGVVIAAAEAVSPPGIARPKGTLGWVFLCADGEFFTPGPDVPVHANALWVVRKEDGIEFIRSGPISEGAVYGAMKADLKVTFVSSTPQETPLCWGLVDQSGHPVFSQYPGKWYPLPCDSERTPSIQFPNGSVYSPPPLTP